MQDSVRNSEIQKFRNSEIQKFRNSEIQKFRNSEIQKFRNFEVIVMDDGGSDETDEVIELLNEKCLIYFRKKNSGPLLTRAEGAEKATGD